MTFGHMEKKKERVTAFIEVFKDYNEEGDKG